MQRKVSLTFCERYLGPLVMTNPNDVFDHPRFIGLWTYRPHGGTKKFCASVMVDCQVQETEMYDSWDEAVSGARYILRHSKGG